MGTSGQIICTSICAWDHPHAYGDKSVNHLSKAPLIGSSPRVWGQALFGMGFFNPQIIIPTRMGTSQNVAYSRSLVRDHPHACGDKGGINTCKCSLKGSSPRVWGQARCLVCPTALKLIIPTRVGTSGTLRRLCGTVEDHPHACGDKLTT